MNLPAANPSYRTHQSFRKLDRPSPTRSGYSCAVLTYDDQFGLVRETALRSIPVTISPEEQPLSRTMYGYQQLLQGCEQAIGYFVLFAVDRQTRQEALNRIAST